MEHMIAPIALLVCLAMLFIVTGINKTTSEYRKFSKQDVKNAIANVQDKIKHRQK